MTIAKVRWLSSVWGVSRGDGMTKSLHDVEEHHTLGRARPGIRISTYAGSHAGVAKQ
jgi:hypothetical protein